MNCEHKFHGVGHGVFVSGEIGKGLNAYTFIYDCGSKAPRKIEPIVKGYCESVSHLNAMFISHFDHDHVSNIAQVIDYFGHVDDVYIPYLMPDEILFAAGAALAGYGDFADIEMIVDPVSWFTNRGVQRVNFVGRGPGEPGGAPDTEPREPSPDEIDKLRKLDRGEKRVGCQPNLGDVVEEDDGAKTRHLGPSPTLHARTVYSAIPWILKLHCYKPDDSADWLYRAVATSVRGLLGLGRSEAPSVEDFRRLTTDQRAELRSIYIDLLPDAQHNLASMSLYSGPLQPASTEYEINVFVGETQRPYPVYREYFTNFANKPAWMGTGDAELRRKDVLTQWMQAYGPLLENIGLFSLAHHSSQKNFCEDLLHRVPARWFFSHSKALRQNGHHPHPNVVASVTRAGRRCIYGHGSDISLVWRVQI